MDEQQKDNQDLVVGNDGSMNEDSQKEESTPNSIEVKVDETIKEPSVDETAPPPEETVIKEEEKITSKEEESVEEAVNFIAGAKSTDDKQNTSEIKEDSQGSNEAESKDDVVKAPDSNETSTGVVAESPVTEETQVISETDNKEANKNEPLVATAGVVQPDNKGMSNNEQNNPHEHRNNKKLAIIVTVFVALLLSGAAIFAFISAQSNTEETSPEPSSQTTQTEELPVEEVVPASQQDVEDTINEIDQTIDSLDSSELSEDTITDDTLGL